jgi:hypothetical protein
MGADVHMMQADVVAAQTRLQREASRAARLERERTEEGGLVQQTHGQEGRERSEERQLGALLHHDQQLRSTVRLGAAALRASAAARGQDGRLEKALRAEEQGVGDAEVLERERDLY